VICLLLIFGALVGLWVFLSWCSRDLCVFMLNRLEGRA
jgi:hypothetical protein